MTAADSLVQDLRNADHDVRARALDRLLERARREPDQGRALLRDAAHVLEDLGDWGAVLAVADAAVKIDREDEALADWLALKAWCLFWLDRPTDAAEVLENAREPAERSANTKALLRIALVSGYVMDVRGAHAKALAWYTKALGYADDAMKPHVLLEMGTSLSKQGRLADALERFDEALTLLKPGEEKHDRLRIHILSRSAAVLENLGDMREALRRHAEAIDAAHTAGNHQLEFECLCRRARTYLAKPDFEGARVDLVAAERLAPDARRGTLQIAHDWARFHRAKGDWQEALVRYRACLDLLPGAEQIVTTFSDVWAEILDGVEDVLARLGAAGVDDVRVARADLLQLRDRSDIYLDQAVAREERRRRAALSTERVRQLLLHEGRGFFAAGYYFDLEHGVATPVGKSGPPIQLDESARLILECLFGAEDHTATREQIIEHFGRAQRFMPTDAAIRKSVSRLKARLALGPEELLRGRRGSEGGGYALML